MSILCAKGLTKTFQRSGRTFLAVDSLDFELRESEFVHIIGRSGSGKSTFLGLLSGILSPSSGVVLFDGEDLGGCSEEEMSAYRNIAVSLVPQSMATMPNLSILENVALPNYFKTSSGQRFLKDGRKTSIKRDSARAQERAMALLDMLEISHLAGQYPRELSGGEIKRVMIARALMNEPRVLLADEPTSDLDRETGTKVMELFRTINHEGVSLVIVTHEQEKLHYGSRVLEMESGRWISQ